MEKKYIHHKKKQKGAVLIMALVITSGILILGSELVLFVLNSLQYGRSVDYSLVAQYAAESGVENAMWQIRKEGRPSLDTDRTKVSLNDDEQNYGWSFLNDTTIDSSKFSTSINRVEKMFLQENASVQVSLYTESVGGIAGVQDMNFLKVSWESESCAPDGQRPWIETNMVQWADGSTTEAQVKKDFQQPLDSDKRFVVVNFDSYDMAGEPVIVRVKTMFCDLSRFTLTLHKTEIDDMVIPIPNYIVANPSGTYRRFQQNSKVVFPQKNALSNMFDFVLFSEDPVQK